MHYAYAFGKYFKPELASSQRGQLFWAHAASHTSPTPVLEFLALEVFRTGPDRILSNLILL